MPKQKLRFFNITEPVTSIYRDLIVYWGDLDWHIHIIRSDVKYREGREPLPDNDRVKVHRIPAFGLSYQRKTGKLFNTVFFFIFGSVLSLFGPAVNWNIFLTQPPLFYLWGILLKHIRNQPYIVVLMDMYPEVAAAAGVLNEASFLYRLLKRWAIYGLKKADGVIVIGRDMKEKVITAGIQSERVHIIPNWVNQNIINTVPQGENRIRKRKGWENKFIILYSGNLGVSHYFSDLLNVALALREHERILFVFIGSGQRKSEISQYINDHKLKNITILPYQPQDYLSESLSLGDVHFVSLQNQYTGLVVPSKFYGSLAVGRPVLFQGSKDCEIAKVIEEESIGEVIPQGDPEKLKNAILEYFESPGLIREQGLRARNLAESKYSMEKAVLAYTQIMNNAQEEN